MTDMTNPRARLDAALAAVRRGYDLGAPTERLTMEATVACAEALSLLVDAHLAAVKPKRKPDPAPDPETEPDPREDLSDDTPVGHGWITSWEVPALFKPYGKGRFTKWMGRDREWGSPGVWRESHLSDVRPATVGDLRRVGLPVAEWPDITAPEPESDEPPVGSFALDRNGDACFRTVDGWIRARSGWSLGWATLQELRGPVTVVHRAEP